MFKFLKDFLFEENEVAAGSSETLAAISALDEKLDAGAGTEQPAGEAPFWENKTLVPTPPALEVVKGDVPEGTAPTGEAPKLVLDIQTTNAEDPAKVDGEPMAGSAIDLDTLSEPPVEAPTMSTEPDGNEKPFTVEVEQAQHDAAAEEPKSEEPAVEEHTPEPEPTPEPVMEHTEEHTPAEPVAEKPLTELDDMHKLNDLMGKAEVQVETEQEAIAKFEKDVEEIQRKLEARRANLEKLRVIPTELSKAKAELEILLKNKKEVEDRIVDYTKELEDAQAVQEEPETNNFEEADHRIAA